ncbi:hypothetical protein CBS101457_002343 [Exobasidium rhododendri]|nr:hypothetical protein CBS101457_002343 [Exobasidium rhododendri]
MSTNANKQDVKHSLKDEHAPKTGNHDTLAQQLEALIERSEKEHEAHIGVSHVGGVDGSGDKGSTSGSTLSRLMNKVACGLLPSEQELDDDFAKRKMGNYIAIRGTDKTFFEDMPLYVRVGMHLLFHSSQKTSLLRWGSVEELLKKMSQREGAIYDDASDVKAVQQFIKNFISTYDIDTKDLKEQDLTKYPTRNSFFYRELKPEVRPIADTTNTKLISSAADSRLTVFPSSESAKKVWIKGIGFSIKQLINAKGSDSNVMSEGSSLAIFRLAPADYHRYNHPIGPVKVVGKSHAGSEYYTVNPDAVNEKFDVFTGNIRDITMLDWSPDVGRPTCKVAFVSIGALLVGSNRFTAADINQTYQRGAEMGYFAYGGSTVIAVFPPEAKIKWDDDLTANSQKGIETLVKVGERIGLSEM